MPHIELFTIGHSNQLLEQFVDLLRQHRIDTLVDIRRFPSSRKFPHFNRENLSGELSPYGMRYVWIESLGGRRPKPKGFDSPNEGLHNESFRNYADYMLGDEFLGAMRTLANLAKTERTAMMCAESVYWRCHRRLISDFVVAGGGQVQHIFPSGECKLHALTKEAKVECQQLTYPGPRTLFD